MPTYETTYLVRILTDADNEEEALEIQADLLAEFVYDYEFA